MAVQGRISHRLNQEKRYRAGFVVEMAVREKEREVKVCSWADGSSRRARWNILLRSQEGEGNGRAITRGPWLVRLFDCDFARQRKAVMERVS